LDFHNHVGTVTVKSVQTPVPPKKKKYIYIYIYKTDEIKKLKLKIGTIPLTVALIQVSLVFSQIFHAGSGPKSHVACSPLQSVILSHSMCFNDILKSPDQISCRMSLNLGLCGGFM
jgi:hypothetical protein